MGSAIIASPHTEKIILTKERLVAGSKLIRPLQSEVWPAVGRVGRNREMLTGDIAGKRLEAGLYISLWG